MNKIWMICEDCDYTFKVEETPCNACPFCGGNMIVDNFHDEGQLLKDKQDLETDTIIFNNEIFIEELKEISNLKYAPKINSHDIADLILDLEEFGRNNVT